MSQLRRPPTNSMNPSSAKSPSVTLEKGAYRLRGPRRRAYSTTPNSGPSAFDGVTGTTVLLLALLALGAMSSFGAAYYLFTTRWAATLLRPTYRPANEELQALVFDVSNAAQGDINEKFLAYLPHSGFHNQRIEFENALTLARLLNRTLLVPPIRLGNRPLRYVPFNSLSRFLAHSGKEGLYHCPKVPLQLALPPECLDYFDFTHVPWEWLVDLTRIEAHQRLLPWWNMTDAWFLDHLGIFPDDTLILKDSDAYHFRFSDSAGVVPPARSKYLETISISELADSTHRLIQIGTLFGSSRLRLKSRANVLARAEIRHSMAFTNPYLTESANRIAQALGGLYLGTHIRVGDGAFSTHSQENSRMIWWKLIRVVLGFSTEDTLALERDIRSRSEDVSRLKPPHLQGVLPDQLDWPLSPSSGKRELLRPESACRGQLHSAAHLLSLNVPLFISTDAQDPLTHPSMLVFLHAFPCTFFLRDFSSHSMSLDRLQSGHDQVMLKPFLESFLDAMVVGKASVVVGTEGSTFSAFVQDVLWRTYHGLPIVQHG